jgi:hypothetical protein
LPALSVAAGAQNARRSPRVGAIAQREFSGCFDEPGALVAGAVFCCLDIIDHKLDRRAAEA